MKKITIIAAMVAACLVVATGSIFAQTLKSQAWYDSKEWLQGCPLKPHTLSIDVDTFANHYEAYPERWKTVFKYLSTHDLKSVPVGVTELSADVRLIVQEYETRPMVAADKVMYERHKKYIDVQCIIVGEEMHGTSKQGNGTEAIPYKDSDDIMFYTVQDVPFYIIRSGYFTVFFPDDMHTTNYGFAEKSNVRKVLFKVKFD